MAKFLQSQSESQLSIKKLKIDLLSRSPQRHKHLLGSDITFHQIDLNNIHALEKLFTQNHYDIVINCAAQTGLSIKYDQFYLTNVKATESLLRVAAFKKIKTFIHFSSPSLFMSNYDQMNISEDFQFTKKNKFITNYAKSKYLAENLVEKFHKSFQLTIILRPATIYGPGSVNVKSQILKLLDLKLLLSFSKKPVKVDMTHIDNVCHAVKCILVNHEKMKGLKKYHVTDDHPVEFLQVLKNIFKEQNIKYKNQYIPFWMASFGAKVFGFLYKIAGKTYPPAINNYIICNFGKNRILSIKKLQDDVGYKPIVKFENGFNDFLKSFLPKPGGK